MDYILPETSLIQIKTLEKLGNHGTFEIEPLSPGFGVTLGNSLRRILLSSLEGAAISAIKIDGVSHQFSTIPACQEDVVEIILNLKNLRFNLSADDPVTLKLDVKGPKAIYGKDFTVNPNCQVTNPDCYLATLAKSGKLKMDVIVKNGRGYVPVEKRKEEKLPLGTIAIDSIFTPVKKIHFDVENTRVGGMTNFDKLNIEITTDGSIDPEEALGKAAKILVEHFGLIHQACAVIPPKTKEKKTKDKITKISAKKTKTKTAKKPKKA
ncbi:MAG: DNA-directed RNA polymerase subunit alpha [Patescibacteria group bacterium]